MVVGRKLWVALCLLPLLGACSPEPADEATLRICPADDLEGQWLANSAPGSGDPENGDVVSVEIEGRCNGLKTQLRAVVHIRCGRLVCKWPAMELRASWSGFEGSVASFSAQRSARFEAAGLLLRGSFISQFFSGERQTVREEVTLHRALSA